MPDTTPSPVGFVPKTFYGSYLEFELASLPEAPDNVWRWWTRRGETTTFATARHALQWIVSCLGCARIWLPAYICPEVPASLACTSSEVRYYSIYSNLSYDSGALRGVAEGDAVLFINYFGRPPDSAFLDTLHGLVGITVIEDCAHALEPVKHTPAHWQMFSPRKLMGVPDGGLAVHLGGTMPPPPERDLPDAASLLQRFTPCLLGLEDRGRHLGQYSAYRNSEYLLSHCRADMMVTSRHMLQRLSRTGVASQRRKNWCILHELLAEYALWDEPDPHFTPLAYPLCVDEPAAVASALASKGIFCPRHWPELPCSSVFVEAHRLAGRILSVPCDQRMNVEDMSYVGRSVRAVLSTYSR